MSDEFPDYETFAEEKILNQLLNHQPMQAKLLAAFYGIKMSDVKKKYSKELVIAKLTRPC